MKQVLIVDDSQSIRAVIASVIEKEFGIVVHQCTDGIEALRLLPSQIFDLIITDINMPQINGLELLQFLQANQAHRSTPVIIVSSDGQTRDQQRGLSLGAANYLVKPFSPAQLIDVVRPYLENTPA